VNVVGSSAWLEFLVDSEKASLFAEPIEQTQELIVPVLVIYELFKKVLRERGEQPALDLRQAVWLFPVRRWDNFVRRSVNDYVDRRGAERLFCRADSAERLLHHSSVDDPGGWVMPV